MENQQQGMNVPNQALGEVKKPYTAPHLTTHGNMTQLTHGPRTGHTDGGGAKSAAPSDRNIKDNFAPIDSHDILTRVAHLPIEIWSYNDQGPSIRHIGPMAQDFAAAFEVGEDDKHINLVDANGVALAAIQALYQLVREQSVQIAALREELSAIKGRMAAREPLVVSVRQPATPSQN